MTIRRRPRKRADTSTVNRPVATANAEIAERDNVQTIDRTITASAHDANSRRFASPDDIDPIRCRQDSCRRGPCCTISEQTYPAVSAAAISIQPAK